MDFMTGYEQAEMHDLTASYLKKTAAGNSTDVDPFATENYRCLFPTNQAITFDGVREMMRTYLPKQISWSREERARHRHLYDQGVWKPTELSPTADRIARFIIPFGGALFILVPMYIMALHQNSTSNLITTTIAVTLLVMVCSIPLRLANETTFSATVGYAAVLIVFVGLTSSPPQTFG
jgi:hypothetical protein